MGFNPYRRFVAKPAEERAKAKESKSVEEVVAA